MSRAPAMSRQGMAGWLASLGIVPKKRDGIEDFAEKDLDASTHRTGTSSRRIASRSFGWSEPRVATSTSRSRTSQRSNRSPARSTSVRPFSNSTKKSMSLLSVASPRATDPKTLARTTPRWDMGAATFRRISSMEGLMPRNLCAPRSRSYARPGAELDSPRGDLTLYSPAEQPPPRLVPPASTAAISSIPEPATSPSRGREHPVSLGARARPRVAVGHHSPRSDRTPRPKQPRTESSRNTNHDEPLRRAAGHGSWAVSTECRGNPWRSGACVP